MMPEGRPFIEDSEINDTKQEANKIKPRFDYYETKVTIYCCLTRTNKKLMNGIAWRRIHRSII